MKDTIHYDGLTGLDWDDRPVEVTRVGVTNAIKNLMLFPFNFTIWVAQHATKKAKQWRRVVT